ncbi:hypothetical protein QZM38_22645 [Burkholderia orbicola]|jgi:mannose/fructose/N-acetylgalactosamine-specific phosphotransferase system component IID|uniref:hypothetical protein n=1 Tax=Burkholderia orbicola TaxID=2978683 RepID=UPI002654D789|nr:hypothetical protein [Burkholderia orbicola]MDN7483618.1 hypothetical protein [Burkholderia orbicola]
MIEVSADALRTVVIAGMAVVAATVIFRFVVPFIGSRWRGETIADHVTRVESEQREKRLFQSNLNTSPGEALSIRLVNIAVALTVMWLLSRFPTSYLVVYFVLYVAVGMVFCWWAKVIPDDKFNGLNWNSRLQLRLFYVWLWPINVARSLMR